MLDHLKESVSRRRKRLSRHSDNSQPDEEAARGNHGPNSLDTLTFAPHPAINPLAAAPAPRTPTGLRTSVEFGLDFLPTHPAVHPLNAHPRPRTPTQRRSLNLSEMLAKSTQEQGENENENENERKVSKSPKLSQQGEDQHAAPRAFFNGGSLRHRASVSALSDRPRESGQRRRRARSIEPIRERSYELHPSHGGTRQSGTVLDKELRREARDGAQRESTEERDHQTWPYREGYQHAHIPQENVQQRDFGQDGSRHIQENMPRTEVAQEGVQRSELGFQGTHSTGEGVQANTTQENVQQTEPRGGLLSLAHQKPQQWGRLNEGVLDDQSGQEGAPRKEVGWENAPPFVPMDRPASFTQETFEQTGPSSEGSWQHQSTQNVPPDLLQETAPQDASTLRSTDVNLDDSQQTTKEEPLDNSETTSHEHHNHLSSPLLLTSKATTSHPNTSSSSQSPTLEDFDLHRRHIAVDFTHTTHARPPVTHTTIKPHIHTIQHPQRTLSIHYHEHRNLIQPIIDPEPTIAPAQHWAQDHRTGEIFKIPDALGEELMRLNNHEAVVLGEKEGGEKEDGDGSETRDAEKEKEMREMLMKLNLRDAGAGPRVVDDVPISPVVRCNDEEETLTVGVPKSRPVMGSQGIEINNHV